LIQDGFRSTGARLAPALLLTPFLMAEKPCSVRNLEPLRVTGMPLKLLNFIRPVKMKPDWILSHGARDNEIEAGISGGNHLIWTDL
jgi:hypothetical protein